LKLHLRSRDDWYTKKEVCEILGVDHKRVQSYIDNGLLTASYHNGHKPGKLGMAMWHIERKDLSSFIRKYCDEFTGRNVDLTQIVEILVGI
jgi:predicted DNA-binding ArsR family transcriptional regulator